MMLLPLLPWYAVRMMILLCVCVNYVSAAQHFVVDPVRKKVAVAHEQLIAVGEHVAALQKEIQLLHEEAKEQKKAIAQLQGDKKLYEVEYEKMFDDLEHARVDMNYQEVQALKAQLAGKDRDIARLKEETSSAKACQAAMGELVSAQVAQETEALRKKIQLLERQYERATLDLDTKDKALQACMKKEQISLEKSFSLPDRVQHLFDQIINDGQQLVRAIITLNEAVAQAFVNQSRKGARAGSVVIEEVVVHAKKLSVTEAQDALKKIAKDTAAHCAALVTVLTSSGITLPPLYQKIYESLQQQSAMLRGIALSESAAASVVAPVTPAPPLPVSLPIGTKGTMSIKEKIVSLTTTLSGKKEMVRTNKGNAGEAKRVIANTQKELRQLIPQRIAEIDTASLKSGDNQVLKQEKARLQRQLSSLEVTTLD